MMKCVLKSTLLLFSCATVNVVHAVDLIEFGKNCLIEEKSLNAEKNRLDNYQQEQDLTTVQQNQIANTLKTYKDEREQLEIAITDCHGSVDPNSASCHKIRNRYNQLIYLEDKVQSDADRLTLDNPNVNSDHEYDKAVYQQKLSRFVAACQDSNTHYALINSTEAYEEVCLNEKNRQTVTCSLF
ncbi:hypothetical protein [Marinomonas transparens]|uniref:Lysozyme inhibitor LprI N-terminal domain-containing protein n=1 Tax=Marinomonas transparens TaxID=2795388 RepID=A0A934JRH2_9GAMM|nr:hypothetical protein [Marinomonas transparens]MBJ7539353.1 hypothetical protein [Marinomonas transparens]